MKYGAHYWAPEVDEMIRNTADGDISAPEMTVLVRKMTGDNRSVGSVLKHMKALGVPIRPRGSALHLTNEMKDFVSAKVFADWTIVRIREEFNAYFGVNYSYTRIWRIALEAHADKERWLTGKVFTEDWLRLQDKFSPEGAICRKHWLWRWRRFDERRTAGGVVFHGKKEPIPHLMNTKQFKDEWTAMQRLFGIQPKTI